MPLVSVSKDGRSILVDANSAHEKHLINAGYAHEDIPDMKLTGGQGEHAPKIAPALGNPGNIGSSYTSANQRIAAKKAAEKQRFVAEKAARDAKDKADAEHDAAALAAVQAKAIADAAEARRLEVEAKDKSDKEAKAKFDADAKKAAADAAK
jgi:hypothetical protein